MHNYLHALTFAESYGLCHSMIMTRLKKPVSYALDPRLLDRLDAWIKKQALPPKKTAVIEAALRDYLDGHEPAKVKR